MRRSRMRRPIGRWTGSLLHGPRSLRRRAESHVFCIWTLSGCRAPSRRGPARERERERDSGPLERRCIGCMRVGRVYYGLRACCVYVHARRERVCAVVKCSRTGCESAHTTMHPGSRAPELRGCWAGPPDERSDEFLSPETRYGRAERAVKVLRLAVYTDRRAFLAVESSECFPLRDRVLNAYLFTRDRTAGLDSPRGKTIPAAVIKHFLARSR